MITCPFVWNEHEVPFDYARYTQFALKDITEKMGFTMKKFEKRGSFFEAITQMKVNYFTSSFESIFYKISLPGRLLFKGCIIFLNFWGVFKSFIYPKKYDLYLSNILIIEKPRLDVKGN